MRNWIVRIACLLTVGALLAGCGSSSSPKKTPTKSTPAVLPTASTSSGASSFPASIVDSFEKSCKQTASDSLPAVPAKYKTAVANGITDYCGCALNKIEASVGTAQFEKDIEAVEAGKGKIPSYVIQSETACAATLRQTLTKLVKG